VEAFILRSSQDAARAADYSGTDADAHDAALAERNALLRAAVEDAADRFRYRLRIGPWPSLEEYVLGELVRANTAAESGAAARRSAARRAGLGADAQRGAGGGGGSSAGSALPLFIAAMAVDAAAAAAAAAPRGGGNPLEQHDAALPPSLYERLTNMNAALLPGHVGVGDADLPAHVAALPLEPDLANLVLELDKQMPKKFVAHACALCKALPLPSERCFPVELKPLAVFQAWSAGSARARALRLSRAQRDAYEALPLDVRAAVPVTRLTLVETEGPVLVWLYWQHLSYAEPSGSAADGGSAGAMAVDSTRGGDARGAVGGGPCASGGGGGGGGILRDTSRTPADTSFHALIGSCLHPLRLKHCTPDMLTDSAIGAGTALWQPEAAPPEAGVWALRC